MRNINIKPFTYMLVILSGISWFIIAYMYGLDLGKAVDFFSILPKVISIDLIFIAIFVKWGWKWPVFKNWLVPFPNLNGTWKGHIVSDWVVKDTGERLSPIPGILTVRQSFFNISCVFRTGEMVSHSYAEGFLIDAERQVKLLAYTYTSKPKILISDRSSPHDGTAVFEIIQRPEMRLNGRYWTERKTAGEIFLSFISREILEELPSNFEKHPYGDNYYSVQKIAQLL